VRATFLLNGTVRGTWKVEKSREAATLVIEPFDQLAQAEHAALAEEGDRLVRFVEDGVGTIDIRFADVEDV
jgi:Winged helix DNA-binding domain